MGKKNRKSEANNKRGTLPAGAVAAGSPEKKSSSTEAESADDASESLGEAENPAGSEEPADQPEDVADDLPETPDSDPGFEVRIEHGYCDICEKEVDYRITGEFLRNHFICTECKSLPRQRAFLHALKMCRPDWQTACMHESSPGGPSSDYLFRRAKNYSISHYYPELPSGTMGPEGAICEDLEKMSYPDNVFDVFITQDVMEHIFDISAAFNEVKRVLRPGGIFLFTVPYYKDLPKSFCRAKRLENGTIRYFSRAVYHGNPVDEKGALVTWDYGRDFPDLVARMCGLHPVLLRVESRYHGLDGEMMEVFLMRKPRKTINPADFMPPASVFPDIPSKGRPFVTPFYDILPPEEEKTEEEEPSASEVTAAETEPVAAEKTATEEASAENEPVAAEEVATEAPATVESEPAPAEESASAESEPAPAEDIAAEEPPNPAQ